MYFIQRWIQYLENYWNRKKRILVIILLIILHSIKQLYWMKYKFDNNEYDKEWPL
jgi:hypothetical protein